MTEDEKLETYLSLNFKWTQNGKLASLYTENYIMLITQSKSNNLFTIFNQNNHHW